MTLKELGDRAKTDLDNAHAAGMTAERVKFWNAFQNNGGTQNYYVAFAYGKFTDENYNPIHSIRCSNGSTPGQQMFYNSTGITDTKVAIYANSNNLTQAFANTLIRRIPLLSVKSSTTYSNTFAYCSLLEEITIEGTIGQDISFADCKKLKHYSIENIIEHLSDTATGKTLTLSYDAVYGWWGDDPVPGMIANSWYELIATKPNWTINLV